MHVVIDRKSLIDASKPEGLRPDDPVNGEVALRDVDFAYPTRPDVPVFRGFSLVAPAGQMTALVGESGSGKSTIVNLVERFYDVDGGAVLLDGADVKSLDVTWLRAQVCIMLETCFCSIGCAPCLRAMVLSSAVHISQRRCASLAIGQTSVFTGCAHVRP